jgi:hypothetical protein
MDALQSARTQEVLVSAKIGFENRLYQAKWIKLG